MFRCSENNFPMPAEKAKSGVSARGTLIHVNPFTSELVLAG